MILYQCKHLKTTLNASTEVKIRDTWRVTLSRYTHLTTSLRSVRIVVFNVSRKTKPSAIATYVYFVFLVDIAFVSSLYDWFPLFFTEISVRQTSSPSSPPQPGLSKRTTATIYTIVICSFEMDGNFQ